MANPLKHMCSWFLSIQRTVMLHFMPSCLMVLTSQKAVLLSMTRWWLTREMVTKLEVALLLHSLMESTSLLCFITHGVRDNSNHYRFARLKIVYDKKFVNGEQSGSWVKSLECSFNGCKYSSTAKQRGNAFGSIHLSGLSCLNRLIYDLSSHSSVFWMSVCP